MGQINIIAYALLLSGFFFYQTGRQRFSIVFLICAILLKPVLGLTLVVFLFEKKWKYFFLLLFILLSIFLLVPIFLHQPFANSIFLHNVFGQNLVGREVYYNQGLLGFISRITSDLALRNVFNVIGTAILAIIVFVKIKNIMLIQKLSLLLTLLLLIDPLSWQHHFVFLLLPFLSTYFAIQKEKKKKSLYVLFILSYFFVAWNFKMPQNFSAFPLSLLLSNQFAGTLLLFGLLIKLV